MTVYKNVDDYLDQAPEPGMVSQVRQIIRENATLAEEVVSYQMPYTIRVGSGVVE